MKYLRNPYFIGIVISLLFWIGAFACVIWAPWVLDRGNRWWEELVFASLFMLGVLLDEFWRFHGQLRFWEGLAILVAANAIIASLLIDRVRELAPSDYAGVIFCELFGGAVFLDRWIRSTKRRHKPRAKAIL
jgi:hypothetical protein